MTVPFIVEKTQKTPYICFDASIGKLAIVGHSLPTNAQEFYKPLNDLVDNYIKDPLDVTELYFQLEYFNTSSSKVILQVFQKFEILKKMGKEVIAIWYLDEDDLDMADVVKTYQTSVEIPITLAAVQTE